MAQKDEWLARTYDWLSRYQTIVRRLGHRGGTDPLTVHRLLASDRAGVAPADVVHEKLLAAVGSDRPLRVIDAGCGVGGTVFFLHARLGGQHDGLTLSGVQCRRATQEAAARGVSAACRFHVRSYDDDIRDLVPDGADLIVAIESLAHSKDPSHTIAHLAKALRPGGRFAIVDDVPADELRTDDTDFTGFRSGWSCHAIARDSTLKAAFGGAGLSVEREEDLTPLVVLRDRDRLEQLVHTNRRWRRFLGSSAAGVVVDSLHGGLMLERLYRRGLMRYRLVVARSARSAG